ncbi:MAG: hypothetical protein V1645_01345 [archaeon]
MCRKGFTFVGFLVVIFVLGIVAAIVAPMLQSSKGDDELWSEVDAAIKKDRSNIPDPIIKVVGVVLKRDTMRQHHPVVVSVLVVNGARCLDDNANWTNRERAKRIYDILKSLNHSLVIESLVRQVMIKDDRLKVLFLGVKLGILGSQERLVEVLMDHGDKLMAEDFLNSGSQDLHEGGRKWASAHGFTIHSGMGSHRAQWGRF